MKKITKRIISIITAMAMTMAMGITAFADYSDLPKDHWAYDTVMTLSDEGAFSGYEDGTFKPDNTITHEEFLSAVIRILGIPTTPVGEDYVQVETDDMFNPQYWTNRWAAWAQPFLNAALGFKDEIVDDYSFINTEKYKYDSLVRKDANSGTFVETLTYLSINQRACENELIPKMGLSFLMID